MSGIRIEGNVSGNVAEVANGALNVNLPLANTLAGFASALFEIDAGTVTGQRYVDIPYVSKNKRLSVGIDTLLAAYTFTSTAQNTGNFRHNFTTMTMTQSAGFLNINPTLTTAAGNYAFLQTWKHFTIQGDFSLQAEASWTSSSLLPVNQVYEWGFYLGTAGTVPTDGVFFRQTNAGLQGIMSYGGTEVETAVLIASPAINTLFRHKIIISRNTVSFWRDDILLGQLTTPVAQPFPFITMSLPLCAMMRHPGAVTGGSINRIGFMIVTMKDMESAKPWSHQMAGQGKAYQGQDGDVMGQLSSWVNTTTPTAVVLTNSSGAVTGLGGIAQITVTFTVNNDGIIFSFQNPVGSTIIPPKTLVVTGVTISDMVSVVLAATPLLYAYTIAYGHTAVAFTTTESASFAASTTKAPRRVPIGCSAYQASAAVGTVGNPINITFQSPIVVNPGEFFAIAAKSIIAAPASGALIVIASVDYHFE